MKLNLSMGTGCTNTNIWSICSPCGKIEVNVGFTVLFVFYIASSILYIVLLVLFINFDNFINLF